MIMKANKQIGFIYKDEESIDKILKDGEVVFEKGFLREKTSTTLPINFGGVGKDLKDYRVYGNTYQNSTSGNQLLDFKNYDLKSDPITNFSFENNILSLNQTVAGTFTRVQYNILDYVTTNSGKKLNFSYKSLDVTNFNSSSATIVQLIIDNNGTRRYYTLLNKNGETATYTIPSNITGITFAQVYIYTNNSNTSVSNSSFSITEPLLYFDENSEYEPYTGGQPSPNPDYPQEIVSCGDRTKNLCGELEQGGYNETTGAKIASSNYRNKEPIKVLPNTNYIFSINGVGQAINAFEYRADGTYIGRIGGGTISANTYFTTSSETAYINIFRGTSAGIEKWQIEQSDTVTPYEPYGYKIPVNVKSENLFDKDNANIITAYIGENYNWVYSGSAICYRIKCKPNTSYTITCFNPNETIFRGAVTDSENVPTSGNPLSIQSVVRRTDNTPITINTRTNTKYILVQLSSSQYLTSIETLQIVEGSTAPSKYIPYYNETTNIYLDEPLRKIDGYSDYIDFANQKVVRRIKEVLLSSENNWASASNTRSVFSLSTFTDKLDGRDNFICSHFKYLGNAQQTDLGFAMSFNSGQYYRYLYIQVPSSIAGVAEVSNFKTWFVTIEPITLDYPLSTPTEESITLPNIPTVEDNNTLNIETEITPSQVYIKYKSNE